MKVMYVILAAAGWIWLAVACGLVWLRLRRLRRRQASLLPTDPAGSLR